MLKAVFNEAEAQRVLVIVNKRVAGYFKVEPKPARFVFLSYIACRQKGAVCLGQCIHESNEIQIKVRPGWQNTAIHELAHLYDPGKSEYKTKKTANDIIRCLRLDKRDYSDYNKYK